ncbi:Phosphotransferase enzyme family protein [Pyrenophora tritici-repentis]|uniref:Phosphotransferase enzyme family protein n=1 Tax=Pyrenophora tritici-repentis TaxID=45151 RepID=A0A2W1F808_9PLEO|nr:Phosphotransferase enzyme family protein [Pyrenophora tritici-repentis]KAF7453385.1 Phosphotransferase enzyme family protein [Pyrenophora tritici-repentis]KAF7576455.1 phosphotransferase family protein [Pyrenophora tritici-repentis]KAG9387138.1 Phosphotransferase enzyme family protein [Pyrenophora tritici-repentis]KAI0574154.1 Phosphotransferase enzyme family protein [Pyrenophora tritici-repentis]
MAWAPAQLPYQKSPDLLPAPQPSESQFSESATVFQDDVQYHRVVAVDSHFIVKYGRGVTKNEGQVLLSLKHHLNASPRLPKLYTMYRMPDTNHVCLIMQRMPGVQLNYLWPKLTDSKKTDICAQLNEIITSIRTIPAPLFGSVTKDRFYHHIFYSQDYEREFCGPVDSDDKLNAALVKRLRSFRQHNLDQWVLRADFYQRNLGKTLVGHKPIFTHSDLQRENIMVHQDASEGFTVSLIDWEDAA